MKYSVIIKHVPFATLLTCLLGGLPAEARTWTDASGQYQLEGDFVDFNDGKVVLSGPDGQTMAIPLGEFSEADRQYVRNELTRRRNELKAEVSDKPGTILYGPGRELCKLAHEVIGESSGLACSRRTPGVFWTHNDSGDDARLYAFDAKGRHLGARLLSGIQAFDFEDVASFTMEGKHYLLVGDVGNNGLAATVMILYLIEEPDIDPRAEPQEKEVPVAEVINYAYEDDHRNCEGLAVDPTGKTILLVTKEKQATCYVYALAWPENNPKKVSTARKIATLKIPPATAMDVSPDGRRAVVATYGNAYEYTRGADEDWAEAFSRRPCEIVLPDRIQGESICYGPDGKTLYLTSEKLPTPLWEVRERPAGSSPEPPPAE